MTSNLNNMKVVCIHTNGNDIDSGLLPSGFNTESETNLILGKEYTVMGIMVYEKSIFYLLDEDSAPYWYPTVLFSVSDGKISSNWYFKIITENESPYAEAIWGYYDLCFVKGYSDRLMDRKEYEMRIYFREKMKIENNETD
jgi:hypothetical protein